MTLTKKHFERIAYILKDSLNETDKEEVYTDEEFKLLDDYRNLLINELCEYFKEENEYFDRERFKEACLK